MPKQCCTLVDLFCGAGGLTVGFREAGFQVISAFDAWGPAVSTYRRNLGNHVRGMRISDRLDLPKVSVIAGGPPCQGFSLAGMRRCDDERNTLVRVYADLVARAKPDAFVFENVEGFLTSGHGGFVFDLLEPLIANGYRVHLRKINAANYGVPQHRKRVVAIGGRGWDPRFPCPTHSAYGAPGAGLAASHLPATPSLRDALGGLPAAVAAAETGSFDHAFLPLRPDDLERAHSLKPGQRMRDLPEHLWHESYRRRAYRRVKDGTPTERRGGAPAGLRRLVWDEPSKAITGGAMNEFIHPEENRNLTIRECARLQSFPDSFEFVGTRRQRIQLIGNAVPPKLAYVIARSLANDLSAPRARMKPGALLSFSPTLASGMSPILQEVTLRVLAKFIPSGHNRQLSLEWA